jgi:hypothetical protein
MAGTLVDGLDDDSAGVRLVDCGLLELSIAVVGTLVKPLDPGTISVVDPSVTVAPALVVVAETALNGKPAEEQ